MQNNGVLLTLLICCVWPVVVHLLLTYGLRYLASRDWKQLTRLFKKDSE
jgi:hypothetical protein